MNPSRLQTALEQARAGLWEDRGEHAHWTGELSSSALSTATAVCALSLGARHGTEAAAQSEPLIQRGLAWLAAHANADGGWGDTTLSLSNISTTTLVWAAFGLVPGAATAHAGVVQRAEAWLGNKAGSLDPDRLATAIIGRYGQDRTFSVPILTNCALAGRLGSTAAAWSPIVPLPFELAVLPPSWFAALRLPVVSYALPALIAMGLARHRHLPSGNPLARLVRHFATPRALTVLTSTQPSNGGFLEATPLTSFVVMSLASSGLAQHPVVRLGTQFLLASARPDGSWPIDTNLATWVTTLSINALGPAYWSGERQPEARRLRDWLLGQQYRERHPYTQAQPGGWAWTDLPGGVPDADDTAGALLALAALGPLDEATRQAASAGVGWLLQLQNSDGGIPTFCRGWGRLPFDRSSSDLTAHALRAWAAWRAHLPGPTQSRIDSAARRARRFLISHQDQSGQPGAWSPLWFGSQYAPDETNWTYGTSRVLLAWADAAEPGPGLSAARWLIRMQRPDGSWSGGSAQGASSVEETALAVEALAGYLAGQRGRCARDLASALVGAVDRGVDWLMDRVEDGTWRHPAPIGFYFAKLWYYERLYPMAFAVAALNRAAGLLGR